MANQAIHWASFGAARTKPKGCPSLVGWKRVDSLGKRKGWEVEVEEEEVVVEVEVEVEEG